MGDEGQVDLYGDDGQVLLDEEGRVKIDGVCCGCVLDFQVEDANQGSRDVFFTLTGPLIVCEHEGPYYYLSAAEAGAVQIHYTTDSGACHHRLSPRVNGQQVPWDSDLAELIDTREDPAGPRDDAITLAAGDRLQIYLRNVNCPQNEGIDGPHDDHDWRSAMTQTGNCQQAPAPYVLAVLCDGQEATGLSGGRP